MTTKYAIPAIQEDSEDDSGNDLRREGGGSARYSSRHTRSSRNDTMTSEKTSAGKERERVRRTHKSGGGRRHHARKEEKTANYSSSMSRDEENYGSRYQERRSYSKRHTNSSSSSDNDDDADHRQSIAQAKTKLTSPSTISTLTSLTVSTNKSNGSSGSNSTVTQASITKRNEIKLEEPMSPAVPDAPDVFAFLETGSSVSLVEALKLEEHQSSDSESDGDLNADHDQEPETEEAESENEDVDGKEESEEEEEEEENEEEESDSEDAQWPPTERLAILPSPTSPDHAGSNSSVASSFHGSDHFSETPDDTDRSTSPERSVREHSSDQEADQPPSPATNRMESQMAAAQQRQSQYSASPTQHNFGTPNMARGSTVYPYLPATSSLSPRYQQQAKQRTLPRAEKLPVTGYELLASRLSHTNINSEEAKIKPMYRKFEALNHRLLLHLQDEISELEEQLHRLDHADTQSRRAGLSGSVVPASRRAAQAAGGELQWHKTDILGRIGFKLAQYNQALSAFNATQALNPPDPNDISQYREYLHTEHPIVEAETHFLDPENDLVSVCSETVRRYVPSENPETQTSESSSVAFEQINTATSIAAVDAQPGLSGMAIAIAVAVLVPILTFTVIPNFIGRITVAGLVAGGVIFTLIQSMAIRQAVLGREGMVCCGIYGGVMVVIAAIMG